uniref:Uncharacterized protein n=1 Tax=Acrobeloides nanus TaxID=290746 RepID=A0A914DEV2_9BILA
PLFDNKEDAEFFLGSLDAIFMIFYAASMFFWGWLGDRSNPKTVVLLGMIGSGITVRLFYIGHCPQQKNRQQGVARRLKHSKKSATLWTNG